MSFAGAWNIPTLSAVYSQARIYRATIVLIEDHASGTQLIQELVREGLHSVKAYKPEQDKVMRLRAQTATLENGFVFVPREAPWLPDYIHELITFPNAKYCDQADSTSQALAWINLAPPEPHIIGFYRREVVRQKHREGRRLTSSQRRWAPALSRYETG
jgi:predicted phage terminase large subunit-like protein